MHKNGLMGRVNRQPWEDTVWDRSRDTIMCCDCGRFVMRKDTITGRCSACYYAWLKELWEMAHAKGDKKDTDDYPELDPPED